MKILLRTFGLSLISLAAACGTATEDDGPVDPVLAQEVEASLNQFNANPEAFMNSLPKKDVVDGQVQPFAATVVADKTFIDAKNERREDSKADAPGANDQARNLVDNLALTKLEDMEALRSAKLPESPWSDDYWGLYAGSIAKRYANLSINYTDDWKSNTDQVRAASSANVDLLSPAEKYDLLVGDSAKTLTKYNLDTGKAYFASYGKVETWMGICHGWSPAAFMVGRPKKAVEVLAADGKTKIRFYPSDIKALSSALWATSNPPTRFIGGRCNVKTPKTDAIGRITDQACRDTNAGTWHLAVVNQIGKAQRGFVLDATFDYEVWNQPVYAYDYTYFNPRTNRAVAKLATAKTAVADFPADKFKAYRAPGTTHIVGVAMNVKWTVETYPNHETTNSPTRDAISGARYLYTLELDKDGNIIGGEWMQNAHPDFLWTPPAGTKATAANEAGLTWDGASAVKPALTTAAAAASVRGTPLAAIVYKLSELARQ